MLHTMNASYMTRVYNNFIKAHTVVNSQNPDPDFIQKMAAEFSKKDSAAEAESTETVSKEDMSLEEYEQYIYDRISQLPMHPTNMQDYIAIQISDAGFAAMKQDPEYEQWVLSSIKSNFMARDPWSGMCGGKYAVFSFGASKEQSRGESFRAGFMNGQGNKLFQKKAKNSFWERRAQRMEEQQELNERRQEERELNQKLDEGLYYGELPILQLLKRSSSRSMGQGMCCYGAVGK